MFLHPELLVVIAEWWCKVPYLQGCAGEEKRGPWQPQAALGGMIYLREEADRRKMFIVKKLIDGVDAACWDVALAQQREPLTTGAFGQLASEQTPYIFRVRGARLHVVKARIFEHLRPANDGGESTPVCVGIDHDGQVAIRGGVWAALAR